MHSFVKIASISRSFLEDLIARRQAWCASVLIRFAFLIRAISYSSLITRARSIAGSKLSAFWRENVYEAWFLITNVKLEESDIVGGAVVAVARTSSTSYFSSASDLESGSPDQSTEAGSMGGMKSVSF